MKTFFVSSCILVSSSLAANSAQAIEIQCRPSEIKGTLTNLRLITEIYPQVAGVNSVSADDVGFVANPGVKLSPEQIYRICFRFEAGYERLVITEAMQISTDSGVILE